MRVFPAGAGKTNADPLIEPIEDFRVDRLVELAGEVLAAGPERLEIADAKDLRVRGAARPACVPFAGKDSPMARPRGTASRW